jgi:hypothetical protein
MTMSVIEKKRIESRELVKVVENIIEDIGLYFLHFYLYKLSCTINLINGILLFMFL